MDTEVQNLTSLLELPGLSKLVRGYTKVSVNVDDTKHLNRRQLQYMDHSNTMHVFSYGDLNLINPHYIFMTSSIRKFTSKGNISLIGNVQCMFCDAIFFNSDLSKWNVENVTDMDCMFKNANVFNSDLSRWSVENVTNTSRMFCDADAFNSDLSKWNVKNVTNMEEMFARASNFTSDLSRWNVENVMHMFAIFQNASMFVSDLSEWNVKNVIYRDMYPINFFGISFSI